jgi:hypothetical protein
VKQKEDLKVFTFCIAPRNPSKMIEFDNISNERYWMGKLPINVNERGQRIFVENSSYVTTGDSWSTIKVNFWP